MVLDKHVWISGKLYHAITETEEAIEIEIVTSHPLDPSKQVIFSAWRNKAEVDFTENAARARVKKNYQEAKDLLELRRMQAESFTKVYGADDFENGGQED